MARYKASEFDVAWISQVGVQVRPKGNQATSSKIKYLDLVTAFDIETTRIPEIDQSFMYIWQWQLGPDVTVIGRTWEEFAEFEARVQGEIPEGCYLVVYVHSLSYEFHFLRNVYEWNTNEVFAVGPRKPLRARQGKLEYRCSYLHSNSSLGLFLSNMGVEHKKLTLDYEKIRYPWTVLSDEELDYCCNDVEGLVEALMKEMENDGDNLYTIPLTSTGYVRRDCKRAMHSVAFRVVKPMLPNYELYKGLREAFRGGDTHANRFYVGSIVENVHSYDISSSYPSVQLCCKLPMSELKKQSFYEESDIQHLIHKRGRAVLMHVGIMNLKLADPYWPVPYLSKHKCKNLLKPIIDNGRVVECEYMDVWLTDIDYLIMKDEYVWDDFTVLDCYSARYGPMPKPMKDVIQEYFVRKTKLKGVEGESVNYIKSKNKLNSCYGMSAQDPAKELVLFDECVDHLWRLDLENSEESRLEKSNKRAFQPYQWGVWITAHARKRLHDAIKLVGDGFVYCDTDSVKYIGEVDWSELNAIRQAEAEAAGAYAADKNGVVHYMGVYEHDGEYEKFRTWGAKKYAYVSHGRLSATIAGVSKDVWDRDESGNEYLARPGGGAELTEHGGLSAFKPGFVFRKAGGTESVFNDDGYGDYTTPDGHVLHIGPNICVRPSTYTLSLDRDYEKFLDIFMNGIDIL